MSSSTIFTEPEAHAPARPPRSLVELLRLRALRKPDKVAYTFLLDGEAEEVSLTYRELDGQARAIASRLQRSVSPGERVLLLYPPSLEYIAGFFGCLYAGAVAVPAYPPRRNRNLLRLRSLVEDAQARVGLTTEAILGRMGPFFAQGSSLRDLEWLTGGGLGDERGEWAEPHVTGDTLAFLQYTSGSTSAPKGVMLSHDNLLHNQRCIQTVFRQTAEDVVVGWLPLYHDMGLIGNVLQPMFVDGRCVLMSPTAFLQRPMRWLEAISRYRATTSGGPNFAYDLCVRKTTAEQRATLDLSSWRVAFNGAEPVRAEVLESFAAAFEPHGFSREAFQPCYGLAEATLLVSGLKSAGRSPSSLFDAHALERHRVEQAAAWDAGAHALVSCGGSVAGQRVLIVDPQSSLRCSPSEVGEVWVAGPSVARGYWNRPEETERTFRARLADSDEGPFLRTGDLGFVRDGELFITGRLKDLIIIRGANHYPQDIELTVAACHPSLRPGCGAAFTVAPEGEERLVVVQETETRQSPDCGLIIEAIRGAVYAGHDLEAHAVVLVRPGSIPKTSSGKIQRHACRTAFAEGSLDVVAQWRAAESVGGPDALSGPDADISGHAALTRAEVEAWLCARLAGRAGVAPEKVDAEQCIADFGLDSLSAVELAHSIEAHLGVNLPLTTLLQNPSIYELTTAVVASLEAAGGSAPEVGEAEARSATHAPSRGQSALWVLQQMAPESGAYNVFGAVRVLSESDAGAWRRAFQALVARHPSLRTSFRVEGEALVAEVREGAEVCVREEDASQWPEQLLHERLSAEAHRPFDLESGVPARLSLYGRSGGEHVLLLTVHHIVSDLWSLTLIFDELCALYEEARGLRPARLPALNWQYADYVRWQERVLSGEEGERHRKYWEKKLGGLPVLDLPSDRPRPPTRTYEGDSELFRIDAGLTARLKEFAREHDATLYMTLLAAFQLLLHRYTRQTEIVVGSATTGRSTQRVAGLVGYFVNPIVLRVNVEGGETFTALLRRVRQVALEAFRHQDYPFALLVDDLRLERDASRSPLFDVAFVMQRAHLSGAENLSALALGLGGVRLERGGLRLESLAVKQRASQFDLTLTTAEVGEEIVASLQYDTALFDAATIRRMAGHLQTLLHSIVEDPSRHISTLPLLTGDERRRLLEEWTSAPSDEAAPARCLHELFEEQAGRTPDAVALTCEGRGLPYAELNSRANRLARRLRSLGVGAESRVGLLLERSPEMVVSLLGVLKAGAAYVPLDPAYPRERLSFMLRDAGAALLLTQRSLSEAVELPEGVGAICIDRDWPDVNEYGGEDLRLNVSPRQLAYVIYTSGSTGTPKGVLIEHANVSRLLASTGPRFNFSGADVWTFFHSLAFDFSVWEIWGALAFGGRLVVVPFDVSRSPERFHALLRRERVTMLNQTPTAFRQLMRADEQWRAAAEASASADGDTEQLALRVVVFGGESLEVSSLRPWVERHGDASPRLVNMYGITETTVHVTYRELTVEETRGTCGSVIGRAIGGWRVYVLDERMEPTPEGVAGEIYVGGSGVGRGYLGRAGLTAERFVPDPFFTEPGSRLYRSGDLARWTTGGGLEYVGRADNQVKVRGFRIEVGEVEAALGAHEGVAEAAVIAREEAGGDKRLVAYVVAAEGREVSKSELRAHLKGRLPEYMVPQSFVFMEALPLTPNGKLDRKALPAPEQERPDLAQQFVPATTDVERLLTDIWSSLLRVERVGVHDNFFELGGDSILSMQIVARANQAGLSLTPQQVFQYQTIAELARVVGTGDVAGAAPEAAVGPAPLTPIQHRFFDAELLHPHHYNQTLMLELAPDANLDLLRRAAEHLFDRHDALRSRFEQSESGWRQVFTGEERPGFFSRRELPPLGGRRQQEEALAAVTDEIQRSLNLSGGPLARAVLLDAGPAQPKRLLLVAHHLVVDGVSWRVILEDLEKAYTQLSRGAEVNLGRKTDSFKLWAETLQRYAKSDALMREADYWLAMAQGRGASPAREHQEGANTVGSVHRVTVELSPTETHALLHEVPAAYHTQINEVLLTALLLAHRCRGGERELLVELEGHGREEAAVNLSLSRTVGWFTSVFPVLLRVAERATLPEALMGVKEQLRAVPNRGFGFGVLRYLGPRDLAERLRALPRAEVSFNYLGQMDQTLQESSWCRVLEESIGLRQSPGERRHYLIEVAAVIINGRMRFDWDYSENIHPRPTVEDLAGTFIQTLRQFITHCQSPEAGGFTAADFPLAKLNAHKLSRLDALLNKKAQ